MEFLTKMTIGRRLTLGYGAILLLMLALTIIGIQNVNFIDHTLTEITDVNSVKQRYAINFRGSVHDRAIAIRDVSMTEDAGQLAELLAEIRALEGFYADSETNMQQMLSSGHPFTAEEKRILSNIEDIQRRALPLVKQIVERRHNGQYELAQSLVLEQARPLFGDWLGAINEFIDYQEQANQAATPLAREVAGNFEVLMLVTCGVAIIIGIVIGKVIEVSLRRSLGGEPYQAARSLSVISNGDLTLEVNSQFPDSLLSSLAAMKDKLSAIVAGIVSAAGELTHQTAQVTSSSKKALEAASSQAALTNTTSEQLEVMKEGLDQVSTVAMQTQSNSTKTSEFSKQGKEAINKSAHEMEHIAQTVNNTVEQIKRLEDTTAEIGNIVSVISGISDQTNLLALNAAIEAARAGESGRGFAVVADEVRQLAKHTGDATEKIEKMIVEVQKETAASVSAMEKTQPLVESGKALTLEATNLLQQIEQQATESLTNVQMVTKATGEQVTAISSITKAMEEINTMSMSSIEALSENTQATASLKQVSEELTEHVGFFTLSR